MTLTVNPEAISQFLRSNAQLYQSDSVEESNKDFNKSSVVTRTTNFSDKRVLIETILLLGFCNAASTTYYFSLTFISDKLTSATVDKNREDFNVANHNLNIVNFLLMALLEVPGLFLFVVMAKKMTRRRFGFLIFLLASVPMWILAICRLCLGSRFPEEAVLAIALSGKIFITPATMCFISLIPTEVFPTKYRATATTFVVGIGRLFQIPAMFSPTMFQKNPVVVEMVFAVWTLSCAVLSIRLPETKDRPLPQNIKDLRVLYETTPPIWKCSCKKKKIDS